MPLPTVINKSAFCTVMESLSGGIAQCGLSEQSNRPFELLLAQHFARGLEHDTVLHICLVRPMNGTVGNVAVGKLHYMHQAAHRSETVGIKTEESKLLLDALEHEFLRYSWNRHILL